MFKATVVKIGFGVWVTVLSGCGASADGSERDPSRDGMVSQQTMAGPGANENGALNTELMGPAAAASTPASSVTAPPLPVAPPAFTDDSTSMLAPPIEALPADLMAAPESEVLEDGTSVAAETPLTLLLVFDNSGSMDQQWESQSRWQAAYAAVVSAVTEFQDNLTVGAIQFPTSYGCDVEPLSGGQQIDFMPGPEFLKAWQERALPPGGSTPLGTALQRADSAIRDAAERGLIEHRFRVVLFSDGEPTCSERDVFEAYPASWLEHGIHTYVLALPGSEMAATLLDDIANAGGTGPEFGGGPAIVVDPNAQAIYDQGASEGASRVVVEDEDDLDDVTHAAAR